MTYEIINTTTSNTLCAYEDERLAIAALRQIAANDEASADEFAVVAFDDDGEVTEVLAGPTALLSRYA